MTDIVDRLRFDAARCEATFSKGVATNIEEAAAEIVRLRDMLRFTLDARGRFLCNNPSCPGCPSWHAKLAEARMIVNQQSPNK